nr:DUF397 domain-containing protein [Phytohabitans houttuyneae]
MNSASFAGRAWFKSVRSNIHSDCVEVAIGDHEVAMRDSKAPDGPVLVFAHAAWLDFIDCVKVDGFRPSGEVTAEE